MVLLAIGVGAWFGKNLGKERSVAPASTVAQASAVAIPEPTPVPGDNAATLPAGTAATPSSSATPALPPDPEVEKRERVANLLYAASSDLEALRLTSPAGNNAYEKYREVLTLQPDNAAARQGIDAIADRYVGLAWRDLQANNLARAAGYVQKAEQLAPGAPDVLAARQALDAKRAAQLAPATAAPLAPIAAPAPDRTSEFGKRFRSFVREQKKAQREAQKSRANQLLDRLGGAR
jgi:hypothetical protein